MVGKHISNTVKAAILACKRELVTFPEISRRVGCSMSSVKLIIKNTKWLTDGVVA